MTKKCNVYNLLHNKVLLLQHDTKNVFKFKPL